MILIADSGSTKTSWCFIDSKKNTTYISTSGINPFFRTSEDITSELSDKLMPQIPGTVERIFFYGAGIINKEKGEIVKSALESLFPRTHIETYSDLLAAAHSTLGKSKGIACILGTGSNSCLYDGKKIVEHIPPLGFILGDEGSGAVLGKKLLADYLKGIMPEYIAKKFQNKFPGNYAEYMESVYKKEKPNVFLSAFVPFLLENISENYCNNLVEVSFNEFVKRNICSYSGFSDLPVNFVGSVAYIFREQLETVIKRNQLKLNKVLKEPLNGLVDYYTVNYEQHN